MSLCMDKECCRETPKEVFEGKHSFVLKDISHSIFNLASGTCQDITRAMEESHSIIL